MDNSQKVTSSNNGKVQIIHVFGRVVYGETDEYRELIEAKVENASDYIFDISNVDQLDSLGFGVLVSFGRKFISDRRKVAIIITKPFIEELFRTANLHHVFHICQTLEEALEILKE